MMVDDLLSEYAEIKETLANKKAAYTEEEHELKNKMTEIKFKLMDIANDLGVTSFKSDTHNAYISRLTKYSVKDGEAFFNWILETGNVQCLQKSVNSTAVKELDELPPGVDVYEEINLNIAKNRKK